MNRKIWGIGLVVVVMLMFIVAGCAKPKVDQVEETTPESSISTPEQPEEGMDIEMPADEEVMEADIPIEQVVDLDQEIGVFEGSDIYFGYDKFNLTPEARKVLAEKASFLNAHPEMKLRIEGHCDERGTSEYNLALGERRAKSAQDYIIFLGINPNRVSTISYGEERPVDPSHNEAAWNLNRRAHFDILSN